MEKGARSINGYKIIPLKFLQFISNKEVVDANKPPAPKDPFQEVHGERCKKSRLYSRQERYKVFKTKYSANRVCSLCELFITWMSVGKP